MHYGVKKKLPPGPKAISGFKNLFRFRSDSLRFLKELSDKYGDAVYFRIGPFRIALLNHPEYIQEVLTVQHQNFSKGRPLKMAKALLGEGLLTSEGAFHKRQSRLIQPAFHRQIVDSYGPTMAECTTRMMHTWKNSVELDVLDEMIKLSLIIVGKTMFDANLEKQAPEIQSALEDALSIFGRISLPFSEWLLELPLPGSLKFRRAKALLNATIDDMIHQRRQNQTDRKDLLSVLLDAAQVGKNNTPGMTEQQVRDEALTLFLTAFDTTSLALTWTWYLLSQNPQVEEELHRELDQVLNGRIPTVKDIPYLAFTRSVFGESMRLYPPIYLIIREAMEAFSVGKFTIPAGTIILMSPYLIHRDTRFHPRPEVFDPVAWGNRAVSRSSKFEYFPFSRGPRSCIGESFAWMEGILVLATVAQFWQFKMVPGHPVEPEQLINLRPKFGMKMLAIKREKA